MRCPSCQAENDDAAEVCFTCRTLLSPVTQGTLIASRYEILSPLGKGGMGAVYKARDRVLDEVVALKILRADIAGAPEMAERFRSEIKLARRVSHFNVCRIHEYGTDGRLQFISMELVEGTSLKQLLRREPLPLATAYELAIQATEGLEAIHKVGIVHRDLKALNIMLDVAGVVRVMDFGIAKRVAAEGAGDPRTSGYVMGTPEYMSPEQARGRRVDSRSDLYSLGIVIFELFTGQVPFRGETPVATLLMHVDRVPPLDGPEAAGVPAPLVPVLRKALAKEPGARHASARELADALRAARRASLGEALPGPASPTGRRRPAQKAAAWLVVAGGIVAAAAAVQTARHLREERLPKQLPSAPPPSERASARPSLAPPESPPPPRVAPSPPSGAAVQPRATATVVPVAVPSSSPAIGLGLSPEPTATIGPEASASPPAPQAAPTLEPGALNVAVTPWADVSVDGTHVGQTPLAHLPLSPGRHDVVLTHPRYEPYRRKVTIRPGETLRLVVDLEIEGVSRKPRKP